MATVTGHRTQWLHNRALLARLPATYPDWIITVAFYTALHAVDALLAHDRITGVVSHETRNAVLRSTNRYLAIWRAYQPLYTLSRTVRYMAEPAQWVPHAAITSDVFRRYLYPVEQSVQRLTGDATPLPPIVLGP